MLELMTTLQFSFLGLEILTFGSFQPFFIDHHLKGTTFIDPRLPADVPPINPDFLHTSLIRVRHRSGGQDNSPTRSEAVSYCAKTITLCSDNVNEISDFLL